MSSRRKSSNVTNNGNNNFKPQGEFKTRAESKGTKPLPQPASVGGTLLTMFIQICRRVIFFNTNLKLGAYIGIMFLSFVCDSYPFPKSYFSQSSNALNQYFVKWGWAWTLVVTIPFVFMTSFAYCCGNRKLIGYHLARIGIATLNWFIFTKCFVYIENNTGKCSVKGEKFGSKQSCLSGGHFWHSLDISGHAFILIYSSLVIVEEAKAIIGWETIDNLLRNENYNRANDRKDLSSPLKELTREELLLLKLSFMTFTPWVRIVFVAMTLLVILWDVMIVSTALYFHIMIEKLVSAVLAIAVWFITYKIWFSKTKLLPNSPGQGVFQYNRPKESNGLPTKTPTSRPRPDGATTFMGLPLFTRNQSTEDDDVPTVSKNVSGKSPTSPSFVRSGPVTRSQSRTDE